jgi:hypothetical protein
MSHPNFQNGPQGFPRTSSEQGVKFCAGLSQKISEVKIAGAGHSVGISKDFAAVNKYAKQEFSGLVCTEPNSSNCKIGMY